MAAARSSADARSGGGELLRCAGRAGLYFGAAGQRGGQGQGIRCPERVPLGRRFLGGGQPGRDGCERLLFAGNVGLGLGEGGRKPFAFADGAAEHRVQVPQALGDGGQPGVRVVKFVQGRVGTVLRLGPLGPGCGECEALAFQPGGDGGQPRGGVVDGGLHLNQRRRLGGPPADGQCGDNVPGCGDGGQVRAAGDQPPGGVRQVLDHGGILQQCGSEESG